jgi:TerY-C metal binding domain
MPKVVIVMARCNCKLQTFGIRLEKKQEENQEERKQRERQEENQEERKLSEQWIADWAFAVKERYAQREGYDQITITGMFTFDKAYPGCPYCHAKGILKCSCGKIHCWDGRTNTFTCSSCGLTGELRGQIEALSVGVDY